MLSKAQIKYIRSLKRQKYRKENHVFIAEGDKIATEFLNSQFQIQIIAAVKDWVDHHQELIAHHPEARLYTISEAELESISLLQTPNQVLLVVSESNQNKELPTKEWTLALDDIKDPGNMGTIIRIADWFGIRNVVCSPDCADVYNPKVVQSAMGGHLRVRFFQANLQEYISSVKMPVLAATLNGKNISEFPRFEEAVLLIGNESKGLSDDLISKSHHLISIPKRGQAESLNAAVATGILCAHLLAQ